MNSLLQIAYRIKSWIYRRFRVRTHGVKVMVFNGSGHLLLVRHSYGDTSQHLIPGGGIRPFEKSPAAARREIREEVGLEVDRLKFVASYYSDAEGKRDSVDLFTAFSDSRPTSDSREIEEANFFPLDALPDTLSRSTLRRIAEYRETRMEGGVW